MKYKKPALTFFSMDVDDLLGCIKEASKMRISRLIELTPPCEFWLVSSVDNH